MASRRGRYSGTAGAEGGQLAGSTGPNKGVRRSARSYRRGETATWDKLVTLNGPYVVVEGPPASGKSTLSKALAKQHGLVLDKRPFDMAMYHDYLDVLYRHRSSGAVLDGFHLSDPTGGLSGYEQWQLEGSLMARSAVVVYCRPAGGDIPWDEKIDRIRQSGLPVIVYDRGEPGSWSVAVDLVGAWVRSRGGGGGIFDNRIVGLGNLRNPTTVYVGNQAPARVQLTARARRKGWDLDRYVWRFCTLTDHYREVVDRDSGQYLWRALVDIPMRDYAIVQAVQLDGSLLGDHMEDPPDIRWVALGGQASQELTRSGVVHEAIPHPSRWRRYRHQELDAYTAQILGSRG